MSSDDVLGRIRRILKEAFSVFIEGSQEDTLFIDIPGFDYDSLKAIEFVGILETEFGIEIDFADDDLAFNLSSLQRGE